MKHYPSSGCIGTAISVSRGTASLVRVKVPATYQRLALACRVRPTSHGLVAHPFSHCDPMPTSLHIFHHTRTYRRNARSDYRKTYALVLRDSTEKHLLEIAFVSAAAVACVPAGAGNFCGAGGVVAPSPLADGAKAEPFAGGDGISELA